MIIRRILQAVSVLALAATIAPPCLFLADRLDLGATKAAMLAATVVWFAVTPLWVERAPDEPAAS